jgi:hypothetical protein
MVLSYCDTFFCYRKNVMICQSSNVEEFFDTQDCLQATARYGVNVFGSLEIETELEKTQLLER